MLNQNIYQNIYTKDQLDDLKLQMEVQIGARLSKVTFRPNVKIICKMKPSQCPFQYLFVPVAIDQFQLSSCELNHSKDCYFDNETKELYKQMLQLIKSKPAIENFLKAKFQEGNLLRLQPKKLLPQIVNSAPNCEFDLYGAIKNYDSRRKLKKKFDNIVNQIKAKLLNKKKPKNNTEVSQQKSQSESQSLPNQPEQTPKKPNSLHHQYRFQTNKSEKSSQIQKKSNMLLGKGFCSTEKQRFVFNSPKIRHPTASSKIQEIQNCLISVFRYDATPPRLLVSGGFRNIFDSSPRILREQFQISQQ